MKDIFIGILIIVVGFIVIDFIYTEKNTCQVNVDGVMESHKCGIIKKNNGAEFYFFDRYW